MSDFDPAQLTDEQIRLVMVEAARRGAAKRQKITHECNACGAIITDTLITRRYCTEACRQRARYWRQKDPETDPTAPFRTPLAGRGWEDARVYTRKSSKKGKRS